MRWEEGTVGADVQDVESGKAEEVAEGAPVPWLLQGRWEVLVWGHQSVI